MVGESSAEFSAHMTTGAVVVYTIEFLKSRPGMDWITQETKNLNRLISALAAIAVSTGISWSYTASTGDLSIHGLTRAAVVATVWEFCKQYVFQQAFYDLLVGKKG